jgi:nicotinamide-nucleotide amidase
VGLGHFAGARRGGATVHVARAYGALGREAVRAASVRQALDLLTAAALRR